MLGTVKVEIGDNGFGNWKLTGVSLTPGHFVTAVASYRWARATYLASAPLSSPSARSSKPNSQATGDWLDASRQPSSCLLKRRMSPFTEGDVRAIKHRSQGYRSLG